MEIDSVDEKKVVEEAKQADQASIAKPLKIKKKTVIMESSRNKMTVEQIKALGPQMAKSKFGGPSGMQ